MSKMYLAVAIFSVGFLLYSTVTSEFNKSDFDAYAATDLSTMDAQIQKVEIQSIMQPGSSPNLIKITMVFQNNGESQYIMPGGGAILLIYAEPGTSPEDLAPDFKKISIESYDSTYHLKIENKYPNFASSNDCPRIKLNVPSQESRKAVFCFEGNKDNASIEKEITDEQYFFKLNDNSRNSSCPNCLVISLNDISTSYNEESMNNMKGFQMDEYVEKKLVVKQNCDNGILQMKITNQDGSPRKGAHATARDDSTLYATADEDGIIIIPDDRQGMLVKIFSGSYVPILTRAETCVKGSSGLAEESVPLETGQTDHNAIPKWIKNNADWWNQGLINDDAFVQGIQFLINKDVLQVSEHSDHTYASDTTKEIPSWIKNNADWWNQGLISDGDFLKGIQHLVKKGIITVD